MFYNLFSHTRRQYSFFEKLKKLIVSYFLTFLFVFFSIFIINIIDYIVINFFNTPSILTLLKKTNNDINKLGWIKIVLIIPLIEEIIFRLFLVTTKLNLLLTSSFILFLFFNKSFFNIQYNSYITYLYLVIIIIINILLNKKIFIIQKIINKRINYFSTMSFLLFGFVHIMNIRELNFSIFFLYPFFILPQIIMGYFITNIRIKLGFLWGVSLHSFINLTGLILST